jgi:spermidine/putrescine transport system substrate-binding protein
MSTRQARQSVNRREFLGRAGLVAGAVALGPSLLAACGGDSNSVSATGKGKQCASPTQSTTKTLAISNWPLYIDKKTVKQFEQATGIKTTYKEDYNDNDEYYAKVRPTLKACHAIGRDMIVSTDWMAARLINLGWIAKLDASKIPNKTNLIDTLKSPTWDPNRDYSLPWQSGMTGIAYNKKMVKKPVTSISDLLDPAYKGKVTFLTEMRDTVGLFMLLDGKDPTKATFADAKSAFGQIEKAKNDGQVRRFTGNDYGDDLTAGNVVAAIAWSGDVVQLQADNKDLEFVIPDDGGMIWADNMLVPAPSAHIANAETWMNYVYDPSHAAQITDEVQYISPVNGVAAVLSSTDPAIAKNPLVNPPADLRKRLHIFNGLEPAVEQQFNQRFNQIIHS